VYRTADGQELFVVDGHIHLWDARPENWKTAYGEGWIRCFYDYTVALSPAEYVWPFERYCYYGADALIQDVFVDGYVDVGIFASTYLHEFFVNGFNTHAQNFALAHRYPDRFILCGSFDPRLGQAGLDDFRQVVHDYPIRGVKLYTAEWRGQSRGWRLTDPWAYRYLEACRELGITNIHVHKGPTIYPLDRDAFDVHDVDPVATDFPDLNFIVEHVGLPRLEDFCWIAVQDKNIYGGLAVAMAFIRKRPRYFAEILANLLFWLGPDRLLFGSDYALWSPKWIIEDFMAFQLPDDLAREYGVDLTLDVKRKILGENAARLYKLDPPSHRTKLQGDEIGRRLASAA
jgi:predicted TIM-barrel fold metal-dependent hydrolase